MTVSPDELLSRYILYGSYVRKDKTVKPESFIPHPYPDLSVTRNQDLPEAQIWGFGSEVAVKSGRQLYGRAENRADDYMEHELVVKADPAPENPYHANVTGWPEGKPLQKMLAVQIAAKAQYIEKED
jgi:hypothetical protein